MNPKKLLCLMLLCEFVTGAKAQFNFTITNSTGTSTITCSVDTINLSASSNSVNTTYAWVNGTLTLSGSTVAITKPGNYVVTATSGTSTSQKNLAIGINTTVPVSAGPSTFLVNSSSPQTFTLVAVSPTVNLTQHVYSPTGGTLSNQSATLIFVPSGYGTYTHCIVNNENGCASCFGWNGFGPSSPVTTGINKQDLTMNSKVFPNPGDGNFTFDNVIDAEQIEIYNAVGSLIKKQSVVPGAVNLNITEQPDGVYIIKALGPEGASRFVRVIKE